jgi:hypothetical protein
VHLSSPFRWFFDALELRRLRRRLPNAHRAWSRVSGKLRPEADAEYLVRLRALAREREQLRSTTERSSRAGNHTQPSTSRCRLNVESRSVS